MELGRQDSIIIWRRGSKRGICPWSLAGGIAVLFGAEDEEETEKEGEEEKKEGEGRRTEDRQSGLHRINLATPTREGG